VVESRQWMKDMGFQDKPLIVTEMGVLSLRCPVAARAAIPRGRQPVYVRHV